MAARVICVGIAVLDRIFRVRNLPGGAGKFFASTLEEVGGGPAASGAVAVARLGGAASLWSRVGADAAGAVICDGLAREGVDVAAIRRYPGAWSSTASICIDARGERQIVTFADPALDPDPGFLPLHQLADAGAALADMRWPQGAAAVLRAAAARDIPGVLDADAVPDPDAAAPLLARASHVVFSEPGLIAATGIADPHAALRAVRARAPGWLAATLGARGAISLDADAVQDWPAFPVRAVDTLGAGDTFHGAFALALAERRPIAVAMRFAAAAAAIKCTRPGGRAGIPLRAEVDRFLEENPP
jgi:sulfofructose kinase